MNVIMEFVPGNSLDDVLQTMGPLHESLIRRYVRQILLGQWQQCTVTSYRHSRAQLPPAAVVLMCVWLPWFVCVQRWIIAILVECCIAISRARTYYSAPTDRSKWVSTRCSHQTFALQSSPLSNKRPLLTSLPLSSCRINMWLQLISVVRRLLRMSPTRTIHPSTTPTLHSGSHPKS